MSSYNNDTTQIKNSHNSTKKSIKQNSPEIKKSSGICINTLKADSYNWLMGIVALLCILFSIGSICISIYINNQTLKELNEFKETTNNNFKLVQTVFLEK